MVQSADQALTAARKIGYPVVAKIVSPAVMHKSDVKGVAVGIGDDQTLLETLDRFQRIDGFKGMLVAQMVKGLELIFGAKNDVQFGPMILLGMGGVGVELYKDVVLRMAPLAKCDTERMIEGLKAGKLLLGYRGAEPVDLELLKKTLMKFSRLVMDLQEVFDSIDLNPVMCTSKDCIIADSRIILKETG